MRGEPAGELKGRSSVSCSRAAVKFPQLCCVPVLGESCTGALALCSFQDKIADNLLAINKLFVDNLLVYSAVAIPSLGPVWEGTWSFFYPGPFLDE